jgi:hypothetical protein
MPHLVAARSDVPRLGDKLHLREHRVLPAGVQESAALVEAVRLARQDGGQVEAEAVDAHLLRPVAQRIRHHLQHARMAEVHRVSGAGIIDVEALLVRQQPVVAQIIDPLNEIVGPNSLPSAVWL